MLSERQRRQQILEYLVELEQELRVLGWWSAEAPSEAQLASQLPFCVDTLSFEQWLQFIYIPRLTDLLVRGQPLPAKSGVVPMAEEALDKGFGAIDGIIAVLGRIDTLLESGH